MLKYYYKISRKGAALRAAPRQAILTNMLAYFTNNKEELMKIYKGHIIANNGKDYTVYLPELKMVNQFVHVIELPLYSVHDFKLFHFSDNSNYKRKIRLHKI